MCLLHVWFSAVHFPFQRGCVPMLHVTTSYTFKLRVSPTQILPLKRCSTHLDPSSKDTSLPQQHAVVIACHSHAPSFGT